MQDTGVIIVAGGTGSRMQAGGSEGCLPKQFLPLVGKPLFLWSLECFDSLPFVSSMILVMHPDWLAEAERRIGQGKPLQKPVLLVPGGARRQDSVLAGLRAFSSPPVLVAVHDAARPGITPDVVTEGVQTARARGNATIAIPAVDTLVQADAGEIRGYLDRTRVFSVQTPQIFKYDILLQAHLRAAETNLEGTDDSSLVKSLGIPVFLSRGSKRNMKITSPEDLPILEAIFKAERSRQ